MRLKNTLIVVKDIERSKSFYRDLFGLQVVADFGENVMLTQGLVLQQQDVWEQCLGREIVCGGHCTELYFEETFLDEFLKKLDSGRWEIEYLSRMAQNQWGRRVLRFYDPDRHVIEVAEVYPYKES